MTGIGALDPVFLQLPNSGILVQFTMMFGLNGDGSSSEETGTTPDILSPAGEPALVTACGPWRSRMTDHCLEESRGLSGGTPQGLPACPPPSAECLERSRGGLSLNHLKAVAVAAW